jgi:hypothetical protein
LDKTLAAAIKADPSLARPAFDTLLAFLKENKDKDIVKTEALAAAIKADPSLARLCFDTLLLIFKENKDREAVDQTAKALAAAIKVDSSLARPAFDILLPVLKDPAARLTDTGIIEALAAAIKADSSLARPAYDTLLSGGEKNKDRLLGESVSIILKNCIAADAEIRNMAALQLFTDYNSSVRGGMIVGFAGHLAMLAKEEVKNGRDPIQFLFDHLEGKQSLMPNGNANTYAVYRQTVEQAIALWMASKKPEAVATQAALKQRLETMRDQDSRLYLRIAAWDTLAAAADLRDKENEENFEDFDE